MQAATLVEGRTTYGATAQRFEAAIALRREVDDRTGRPVGAARYLVTRTTGELVIAVGDLQDAARRHVGSSLPRMARRSGGRARVDARAHSTDVSNRDGAGSPARTRASTSTAAICRQSAVTAMTDQGLGRSDVTTMFLSIRSRGGAACPRACGTVETRGYVATAWLVAPGPEERRW